MQQGCIQISAIVPIDDPPHRDFGATKTAGEPFYKANKGGTLSGDKIPFKCCHAFY